MDGTALVEQVRAATRTELERLGSDKALVAATDATLETERVLAVVAGTERAVRDAAKPWAEQAGEDPAREAFERAAATAAENYEAVLGELDGEAVDPGEGVFGLDVDADGDPGRLGALVGAALVADRMLLQAVSFFVNEADERRADLVRGIRDDADERVEATAAALGAVCEEEAGDQPKPGGGWDRAGDAASTVVRAAYEDYVEALEAMGIDPKPVC